MPVTPSPLRYPGGKTALAPFLKAVIKRNGLKNPYYAEPYCGGAGAAITLLQQEVASEILLNDIDPAIYSFWWAVLNRTDELCEAVEELPLNIEEWQRQREIYFAKRNRVSLNLAIATLFLNRANRSGIIEAGPIGGQSQSGKWRLDVRFNRPSLVSKIRSIAAYRDRIRLHKEDALEFLKKTVKPLKGDVLAYLDPPYFVKGQSLYRNYYEPTDHAAIAKYLRSSFPHPAVVSYDYCEEIKALYQGFKSVAYGINYTAQEKHFGREILVVSDDLHLPDEIDPLAVGRSRETRESRRQDEQRRASLVT